MGQIVQEGRYRGGTPPYGYRLEKQGRINKKNHEVYELVKDEAETTIVKLIFDKYVNEGYGAQRLVGFLLEQGICNRKGDNFANTTLIKMLRNIMYIGIMRSGESRSEPFEELQIINPDVFERAQEIMKARTQKHSDVPLNTKANALVSGLVYCGHCGSKLVLTTSSGGSPCPGGASRGIRYRYQCHYKVRHPQSCEGQSGYAVNKLDGIFEEALMKLFDQIREIPMDDVVSEKYKQQITLLTQSLKNARVEYESKKRELDLYETEVSRVILGESQWNAEILQKMMSKTQESISTAELRITENQKKLDDCATLLEQLQKEYSQVVSWSKLYSTSSIEAKKMIAARLIRQVRVYKNYRKVEIDFTISKKDFQTMAIESETSKTHQERKTSENVQIA